MGRQPRTLSQETKEKGKEEAKEAKEVKVEREAKAKDPRRGVGTAKALTTRTNARTHHRAKAMAKVVAAGTTSRQ